MEEIRPVASRADEFPNSHYMQPCLFFSIWILDQSQLGLGGNAANFREFDEIVDPFPIVLKMEARVLEGKGKVDYRLSKVLDLLLCRDLADCQQCRLLRGSY